MRLKTIAISFAVLLLLGAGYLLVFNSSIPGVGGKPPVTATGIAAMCARFPEDSRYNNQIAFYADLQQHSGRYRFFVLDLVEKKILHQGIVLNGREQDGQPIYSNVPGSQCSSRGLAKVGYSYHGRFGKAYKLIGLDATNSNMMARAVVLHSWRGVPNMQVPFRLPNSEGCPTVSTKFMKVLERIIDRSDKPILLYIN